MELAELLLIAESAGLVDLTGYQPHASSTVSQRPVVSPLARWQISRGKPITNLWCCSIKMDEPVMRHLCSLLDGSRDRTALANDLAVFMEQKQLFPRRNGTVVRDPAELRHLLMEHMDANLERFARLCLLVK